MLKRLSLVFVLLGITVARLAWGQSADLEKGRVFPDFDARDLVAVEEPASSQRVQAAALMGRRGVNLAVFLASPEGLRPGTRVVPNRHGLPKLLFRDGGSLSAASTQEPEAVAKSFLRTHGAIFPFAASEVDALRLVVKDVTATATFLVFNQTLDGIDVFNGQVKFTLSKTGEVVQAGVADVVPELSVSTAPRLSPIEAVRAAYGFIGVEALGALSPVAGPAGKTVFDNPRSDRYSPITAELLIFPMTAASARLAYRILLDADPEGWYEILVDAEDGSLLFRHNLYLSAGTARVWTQSPMQGAREVVTFPDEWLSPEGIVTTGNNAEAYIDSNLPGDSPDPINNAEMLSGRAFSPSQVFDFEFGDGMTGLDPRNYKSAAVTNLFYFLNKAHDYYYGLGFTEAAGNFQTDNFGRGGLGNDAVVGEAQYGGFTNNAAFAPTPEGTPPRLRMGLFTRSTAALTDDLDSDYGGDVVFHEYAHGVSTRLVGGTTSTSCLRGIQSGAMGEGWSDYFAASFFNNPVAGVYISQNATTGIRRQSYEGYTFTYQDIGNSSLGYEVHADGEIWAAGLWDLRQTLGQDLTDNLVVGGLKSTPCNPSMTDARDAILSADQAQNGGANRARIWEAFARHGLGYSATGVDGTMLTGTRYDAAYDQPPDLQPAGNPAITSNPLSVATGLGNSYAYQVTASNPNGGALNYVLTQGPAGMTVDPANGQVSWIAAFVGQRVKITVTDGRGGKVVHGYFLPVMTPLSAGTSVTIAGQRSSAGYANLLVPSDVPVLQVTLRGGLGDTDLVVTDPDGMYSYSRRNGITETLSFPTPKPGRWQVEVDGYATYSGVTLTAALITPTPLSPDTTLSGLSGVTGSETLYRVTIPAGASAFSVWTRGGAGDVDIYVRKGRPALCQASSSVSTACYYDKGSAKGGNSEAIGLGGSAAGDWYLDLSGYTQYAGVTLTTSTRPISVATPSSLPAARAGVPYCLTLTASGGTTSYQWSLDSGSTLPEGLRLSVVGGITGTPTAAGTYTFTIRVTDASSVLVSTTFTLSISDSDPPPQLATVSGASFIPGAPLAPDSVAAVFGSGQCLANGTFAAPAAGPLPTALGSMSVKVTDSAGTERLAPLWFVAAEQINYLIPPETSIGLATVTLTKAVADETQIVGTGTLQVEAVAPGMFSMNANGQGVAVALAIRSKPDASQSWQYVFPNGCYPGSCVTVPVDLGPETDQVFLQLYGTGIRGRSALAAVSATIGGVSAPVEYAGPVAGYSGLDQVNLRVPRSLMGRGEVDVVLQADGKTANSVKVNFK